MDGRGGLPVNAVAAFAAFVRQRLADVGGTIAPLLRRADGQEVAVAESETAHRSAAHQFAMVIIGAAAPFAPTSHARARLLRQAHASGLLSTHETEQVRRALGA